jgi:hypothetical protein
MNDGAAAWSDRHTAAARGGANRNEHGRCLTGLHRQRSDGVERRR